MKSKSIKTPDDYRAVFLQCGLRFGQNYGSKSGYVRSNPQSFFIANSCVYLRDGTCVWRGDIDLADRDDKQSLVCASHSLNRQLLVLREQTESGSDTLPRAWLFEDAVVTVWRGRVAIAGSYRRRFGTLEKMMAFRSRSNRPSASGWASNEAGRRKVAALTRVGGKPLSREMVAARLNISLVSLYRRIESRELVVWTDAVGHFQFPSWQFRQHEMLPGVIDCLHTLDTDDHWSVMRFFLTGSEMAGGIAPLKLLREGKIAEAKAIAFAAAAHA